MLGFGEVRPESHRYPFLASLLCIPSQDAIDEASPTTDSPDDGAAAGRLREARGLARMPDDAIAARAEALASKLPPDGWRVATDPETGRDYLFNGTGEVRWRDEAAVGPDADAAPRDLLRKALDADFGQLLTEANAPFFAGFFRDVSKCPAVTREGWPDVVAKFVKKLPVLVARSRDVAGADARAALVDAIAEPCFYLAANDSCHAAFDADIDPARAFARGDHASELPPSYRDALDGFRRAAFDRLTEALVDNRRRHALRRAFHVVPRRSILTLAKVGTLPSSPAVCTALVKLFAEKGMSGKSVLQRLAAAGLGARDARTERDACLAKAQPAGNCTAGMGLRLELTEVGDAELVVLREELADGASTRFSTLKGAARDALGRALDLETYARRCDRLVGAYGDEAYVDLVVALYPALLAPLGYALQSTTLDGAQVADHLFGATSRVLDVFEGSLPLARKLRVLDDELRGALGAVLGLAHRASLHHAPRVRSLCAWAADCAVAWRPPLAEDHEPLPTYAATHSSAQRAWMPSRSRMSGGQTVPRQPHSSRESGSSASTRRRVSGPRRWMRMPPSSRTAASSSAIKRPPRRLTRDGSWPRPCRRAASRRSVANPRGTCCTGGDRARARRSPWRRFGACSREGALTEPSKSATTPHVAALVR